MPPPVPTDAVTVYTLAAPDGVTEVIAEPVTPLAARFRSEASTPVTVSLNTSDQVTAAPVAGFVAVRPIAVTFGATLSGMYSNEPMSQSAEPLPSPSAHVVPGTNIPRWSVGEQ